MRGEMKARSPNLLLEVLLLGAAGGPGGAGSHSPRVELYLNVKVAEGSRASLGGLDQVSAAAPRLDGGHEEGGTWGRLRQLA